MAKVVKTPSKVIKPVVKKKSAYQKEVDSLTNKLYKQAKSGLDAEKNTAQYQYNTSIKDINQNQFDTTENQKELMNANGWGMDNSGLAVGEVGKIKLASNKLRTDAKTNLGNLLTDIARRTGLAKTDAQLQAQQIAYQHQRDRVADSQWERAFNRSSGGGSGGGGGGHRSSGGSSGRHSSGKSGSSGKMSEADKIKMNGALKEIEQLMRNDGQSSRGHFANYVHDLMKASGLDSKAANKKVESLWNRLYGLEKQKRDLDNYKKLKEKWNKTEW